MLLAHLGLPWILGFASAIPTLILLFVGLCCGMYVWFAAAFFIGLLELINGSLCRYCSWHYAGVACVLWVAVLVWL